MNKVIKILIKVQRVQTLILKVPSLYTALSVQLSSSKSNPIRFLIWCDLKTTDGWDSSFPPREHAACFMPPWTRARRCRKCTGTVLQRLQCGDTWVFVQRGEAGEETAKIRTRFNLLRSMFHFSGVRLESGERVLRVDRISSFRICREADVKTNFKL